VRRSDGSQALDVNPFKYGLAAASESHTGLATTDEDNLGRVEQPVWPPSEPHDWAVVAALVHPRHEAHRAGRGRVDHECGGTDGGLG
jgi:hypothetical protein